MEKSDPQYIINAETGMLESINTLEPVQVGLTYGDYKPALESNIDTSSPSFANVNRTATRSSITQPMNQAQVFSMQDFDTKMHSGCAMPIMSAKIVEYDVSDDDVSDEEMPEETLEETLEENIEGFCGGSLYESPRGQPPYKYYENFTTERAYPAKYKGASQICGVDTTSPSSFANNPMPTESNIRLHQYKKVPQTRECGYNSPAQQCGNIARANAIFVEGFGEGVSNNQLLAIVVVVIVVVLLICYMSQK